MTEIWQFLLLIGIPTGAVGLGFWAVQRKISRSDAIRETREVAREKHQIILIRSVCASIALGEATARALRDGHTNGDVTKALEYAQQIKQEQRQFFEEQGIKNII